MWSWMARESTGGSRLPTGLGVNGCGDEDMQANMFPVSGQFWFRQPFDIACKGHASSSREMRRGVPGRYTALPQVAGPFLWPCLLCHSWKASSTWGGQWGPEDIGWGSTG